MSDSTLKLISQQAKDIVRQVSGASSAAATAEHTAKHLQNVEHWAQQEFLLQRRAHEPRLTDLEQRVSKLEKVQKALTSAGTPASSPRKVDALDVVSVSPSYYEEWQGILSQIATREHLFDEPVSVMELYCGAAKTCSFLQDKVSIYVGVEPSDVLRSVAQRKIRDVRFSFVDMHQVAEHKLCAELVLLLAETQRWSVHDLETLLGVAEAHLADTGQILLHIPYTFAQLQEAGWGLEARLQALGLQAAKPEQSTTHGSYVLIGRKQDV